MTAAVEAPAPIVVVLTPHERAEAFAKLFQGNANSYALAYGGPIYLVGSFLTAEKPGDIDIRVALAREDLELLFGEKPDHAGYEWSPAMFRRHREELKQSRRLTRRWCANETRRDRWASRFDFQFTQSLFSDVDGEMITDRPKLRLDKVPNDYFRAGQGDP